MGKHAAVVQRSQRAQTPLRQLGRPRIRRPRGHVPGRVACPGGHASHVATHDRTRGWERRRRRAVALARRRAAAAPVSAVSRAPYRGCRSGHRGRRCCSAGVGSIVEGRAAHVILRVRAHTAGRKRFWRDLFSRSLFIWQRPFPRHAAATCSGNPNNLTTSLSPLVEKETTHRRSPRGNRKRSASACERPPCHAAKVGIG